MAPASARLVWFVVGGFMIALSAFVYAELQAMGFPDGHLTELERAERPLGYLFVSVSVLVGLSLLLATRLASWRRALKPAVLAWGYAAFIVVLLIIDLYWRGTLADGSGG